tara:strand:- start:1542 stop:1706 length:165 start_codon:yes stop_codon:yes gene_type:complete
MKWKCELVDKNYKGWVKPFNVVVNNNNYYISVGSIVISKTKPVCADSRVTFKEI